MSARSAASPPFAGLRHVRAPGVDTISWANRRVPRNGRLYALYISGFLLIIPLVVFLTAALRRDFDAWRAGYSLSTWSTVVSVFVVALCWAALLLLTYRALALLWTVRIRITDDAMDIAYEGLLSPRPLRLSEGQVWRLSFEKVTSERDEEPRHTLNIYHDDRRRTLAYWLRPDDGYRLFQLLGDVFQRRGWNVDLKAAYAPGGRSAGERAGRPPVSS